MGRVDPKDQLLAELQAENAVLRAENAALRAENATLRALVENLHKKVAELEAKLSTNSTNSSKPPSSDGLDVKRDPSTPKGGKRGGQPGHKANRRELLPTEKCRKVYRYQPTQCRCGSSHLSTPELRARHQVTHLPETAAPVDEHQSFAATCLDCGNEVVEPIPPEHLASAFGPSVVALVVELTGVYRLSKRSVQQLLLGLFGIEMSTGAVCDQEQTVARAVKEPVAEVAEVVKQATRANGDETPWKQGKQKAWLWVVVTNLAVLFQLATTRSGEVSEGMLGSEFQGVFGSDRYAGYLWIKWRQLCWAHLIRDFLGWMARGGEDGVIGEAILAQVKKMFRWWNQLKDGDLSRAKFQEKMKAVEQEVGRLLRLAQLATNEKVAGMAKAILAVEASLWTFVHTENVEPTNNIAERILRHAVIWRKLCFGTASERGSRYVERILTVMATLKLHGRSVREYLTGAVEAYRRGLPAPSLLPAKP